MKDLMTRLWVVAAAFTAFAFASDGLPSFDYGKLDGKYRLLSGYSQSGDKINQDAMAVCGSPEDEGTPSLQIVSSASSRQLVVETSSEERLEFSSINQGDILRYGSDCSDQSQDPKDDVVTRTSTGEGSSLVLVERSYRRGNDCTKKLQSHQSYAILQSTLSLDGATLTQTFSSSEEGKPELSEMIVCVWTRDSK